MVQTANMQASFSILTLQSADKRKQKTAFVCSDELDASPSTTQYHPQTQTYTET